MWQNDFYPTPHSIAQKLFKSCSTSIYNRYRMILEPSAGKGDLIDAYLSNCDIYIRELLKANIHTCEIEPELCSILSGKGYTIVANDFLTFEPSEKYDLILMNPPFANAYEHIMKAWNILDDGGEIACILPENFLERHTKMKPIFEKYGKVVPLGDFNQEDTFRNANVRVSGFYLCKPSKENILDFESADLKRDFSDIDFSDKTSSEVAVRDVIGNYVTVYNALLEMFTKISELSSECAKYAKFMNCPLGNNGFFMKGLSEIAIATTPSDKRYAYNNFVSNLKHCAWESIFSEVNMSNLLTSKVRQEFNSFKKTQANLSFSRENIEKILESIFLSSVSIKKECIVDAFEIMTSFDKNNKVHIEGWKTNSFYKVNKKVIVPYGIEVQSLWYKNPHINYQYRDKLVDIDKALCFLTGKKYENILSIEKAIGIDKEFGEIIESEFFLIRCYKKGTIHLNFKDMDLLALFNRTAVKEKWNLIGTDI